MRVHDHADVDAERIAKDDVRRLAPTPASAWSSSIVRGTSPPNFSTSAAQQALMFFALLRKKPVDLTAASISASGASAKSLARAIFFEQFRRDEVHALVRALRGKNRGDEQLQRIGKIQFAMRVRISPLERGADFFCAFLFGGGGFAWHQNDFVTSPENKKPGREHVRALNDWKIISPERRWSPRMPSAGRLELPGAVGTCLVGSFILAF